MNVVVLMNGICFIIIINLYLWDITKRQAILNHARHMLYSNHVLGKHYAGVH